MANNRASERGSAGWYDRLYVEASDGSKAVPWDHGEPTPYLVTWLRERFPDGVAAGRAVVVGCAYGDDAELVASYGFDVTAFDVSRTAVDAARDRHPDSNVQYWQADLLELPPEWRGVFSLVIECTTLQSLEPEFHATGAAGIAALCASGGEILVVARCPTEDDPPGPPWLLIEQEVRAVGSEDACTMRLDRLPMRGGDRWVGEFTVPG